VPRLSDWGKEEAGRRFLQLINELQVVLPSDRRTRVETQPGIDSIRSQSYEDQNSDAGIDIVMVQLEMQGRVFLSPNNFLGGPRRHRDSNDDGHFLDPGR